MEKVKIFDKVADYKVHITNDYSKFKILEGNREVGLIGFIKKMIAKYGFMWMPILVNEFFDIIDGQHRLEACRELDVPVHYIVQPGLRLEHCKALNAGRKNWSMQNYIHAGAVDRVEYRLFEILSQKHPQIPGPLILCSYNGSLTGGGYKQMVKNGTLPCSEKDFSKADKTCTWLEGFLDEMKQLGINGAAKTRMLQTLIFAYNHPLVNVRDLTRRMHDNMTVMKSYLANDVDAIMGLEKIYNYKCHSENKIDLLSDYRKKKKSRAKEVSQK